MPDAATSLPIGSVLDRAIAALADAGDGCASDVAAIERTRLQMIMRGGKPSPSRQSQP